MSISRRELFKAAAASAVASVCPEELIPTPEIPFFEMEIVHMPIVAHARKLRVDCKCRRLEDGTLEISWENPASMDDQLCKAQNSLEN